MFSDKITQSIAEAAKKVMEEELKGNQHKIDANKNNKIDAHDFKLLRSKKQVDEAKYEPAEPDADAIAKKKAREEAQRRREEKAERDADDLSKDYKPKTQSSGVKKVAGRAYGGSAQKDIEEDVMMEVSDTTLKSYRDKASTDVAKQWSAGNDKKVQQRARGIGKSSQKLALGHYPKGIKEDVEQIDETPVTKAKAPYRPGSIDPATGKTREAPKGTYAYDKAQRKKLKESFSGLIESYIDGGIKSLFKKIEEEVDNETFTKEFKDQKDKFDGKKKGADVAAPASQGVVDVKEETHTEVQVVDMTDGSQKPEITTIDLEEKTLTSGETAEKERIVKSMKKNLPSFKERYGERAKSVMYATATKIAKEKE